MNSLVFHVRIAAAIILFGREVAWAQQSPAGIVEDPCRQAVEAHQRGALTEAAALYPACLTVSSSVELRSNFGAVLAALGRYNPMPSILSGTWEKGAIRFSVVKNIGTDQASGRCALTSAAVTPFGTNQIAAEWLDGPCGGGQLLLNKIGP